MRRTINEDDTNLTAGTPALRMREIVDHKHERYNPLENLNVVTVWDEENEHSVIRLVTEEFRKLMLALPDEMKAGDEQKKKDQLRPSATMRQLKILFWTEYNRVIMHGEKRMMMKFIYGPAVDERYWAQLRADQKFLAWLITPPANHTVQLAELLELSFEKIRGFIEIESTSPKTMELQYKIALWLDARVNGAIATRVHVESKNTTLNANIALEQKNASTVAARALAEGDMEQLTAELRRLESLETDRKSLAKRKLSLQIAKQAASNESLDGAIEAHFSEIEVLDNKTPPSIEASGSPAAALAPSTENTPANSQPQGEAGGR